MTEGFGGKGEKAFSLHAFGKGRTVHTVPLAEKPLLCFTEPIRTSLRQAKYIVGAYVIEIT